MCLQVTIFNEPHRTFAKLTLDMFKEVHVSVSTNDAAILGSAWQHFHTCQSLLGILESCLIDWFISASEQWGSLSRLHVPRRLIPQAA